MVWCGLLCGTIPTFFWPVDVSLQFLRTIIIHNMTEEPLYSASYYVRTTEIKRVGEVQQLNAHEQGMLERPHYSFSADRFLYVARQPEQLKDSLTEIEANSLPRVSISPLNGRNFYIDERDHVLFCRSWLARLMAPAVAYVEQFFSSTYDLALQRLQRKYATHEYAYVRKGTELCHGEKEFLIQRAPYVTRALQTALPAQVGAINNPHLVVGYIGSTGGVRAMLSTLSVLHTLDELSLLDTLTYVSGTSGSTWALLSWYSTPLSIKDWVATLKQGYLGEDLLRGKHVRISEIAEVFLRKIAFSQYYSVVDIFGELLAQKFLGAYIPGKLNTMTLSEQIYTLADGSRPYPLNALAIDGGTLDWFECTPHECGSEALRVWTPTWAFGRLFKHGISQDFAPPLSIGFYIGTCGSALSSTVGYMLQHLAGQEQDKPMEIYKALGGKGAKLSEYSFTRQVVHNPNYQLGQHPLNQLSDVVLVDGGCINAISVAPYLRRERAADLIIVCNFSGYDAYGLVDEYLKARGVQWPSFQAGFIPNGVAVLDNQAQEDAPVVLLITMGEATQDIDFLSFFNFTYTPDQVNFVMDYVRTLILNNKDVVYEAYTRALAKKSAKLTRERKT